MSGIDLDGAIALMQRFAGTLVDRQPLHQVLEQLGEDIRTVLDVRGAGVMIEDGEGHLRFTSTSDGVLHRLEALQVELDEGPCLLAYRTGETVIASDLATDERFPAFGERAGAYGMAAVYSFPMRTNGKTVGALNLYNAKPEDFSVDQVRLGRVFADIATCYLKNAEDKESASLLTTQLQRALDSRVVIEQAKGKLSATLGCPPDEAFQVMRSHARATNRKLHTLAEEIVDGVVTLDAQSLGA